MASAKMEAAPEVMDVVYTGNFTDEVVTMSGKQYRLLTLTTSGTLTISQDARCEMWYCGAGFDGNRTAGYRNANGGAGGVFRSSNAFVLLKNTARSFTIGMSNGASTTHTGQVMAGETWGNLTAGSGYGKETYPVNAGGGVSTRPFNNSYFQPHCAGGGCGAYNRDSFYAGGNGGANGTAGTVAQTYTPQVITTRNGGSGGNMGGGMGGGMRWNWDISSLTAGVPTNGGNGTFYGAGGGGKAYVYVPDMYGDGEDYYAESQGGLGYQGVCYVRFELEA